MHVDFLLHGIRTGARFLTFFHVLRIRYARTFIAPHCTKIHPQENYWNYRKVQARKQVVIRLRIHRIYSNFSPLYKLFDCQNCAFSNTEFVILSWLTWGELKTNVHLWETNERFRATQKIVSLCNYSDENVMQKLTSPRRRYHSLKYWKNVKFSLEISNYIDKVE